MCDLFIGVFVCSTIKVYIEKNSNKHRYPSIIGDTFAIFLKLVVAKIIPRTRGSKDSIFKFNHFVL